MMNKDRSRFHQIIENDIRLLSSEILRLIKLPYYSKNNADQIKYLEEVLAAYERDLKKYD